MVNGYIILLFFILCIIWIWCVAEKMYVNNISENNKNKYFKSKISKFKFKLEQKICRKEIFKNFVTDFYLILKCLQISSGKKFFVYKIQHHIYFGCINKLECMAQRGCCSKKHLQMCTYVLFYV